MMRISLFVAVFAVTSLALAGCAADAEPTGSEPDPNDIALVEPTAPVAPVDRTNDARYPADFSKLLPHPSDEARARQNETFSRAQLEKLPAAAYGVRPSDSLIH